MNPLARAIEREMDRMMLTAKHRPRKRLDYCELDRLARALERARRAV